MIKNHKNKQEEKLKLAEKLFAVEKKGLSKDKTKLDKSNNQFVSLFNELIFQKEKKRFTCEDTIPYFRMVKNGICQIDETHYSKSIKFEDINYRLALDDDKDLIFSEFADFLNSFDPDVSVELSYVNELGKNEEMQSAIEISDKPDVFNEVRAEFRQMLKSQLLKGNNGLKRSKYLTFTVEAESPKKAIAKLERLEADILNSLNNMEVRAESLLGEERLKIIHDMLNPTKKFNFSYSILLV